MVSSPLPGSKQQGLADRNKVVPRGFPPTVGEIWGQMLPKNDFPERKHHLQNKSWIWKSAAMAPFEASVGKFQT